MFIRPATESDRAAILRLMRPRDYNRINLRPACFVVAEDAGVVVGIGQIKRHRDGTPELASLVVAADRRGEGIGGTIVRTLVEHHQACHRESLYLFCLAELEGFYKQLGFRSVMRQRLPRLLALIHALGNGLGRLPQLCGGVRLQVIAMKTEGAGKCT